MAREPNLGLDGTTTKRGGDAVRICVRYADGYTREGAPTLTPDCESVEALERAVALLVEDLEAAVQEAAHRLEGRPRPEPRAPRPAAGPRGPRPHLASDQVVADIMTPEVRTLGRNHKVSVADELMRVGQFRHAVVVDEEGGIAGVLSQRDIMLNALAWHLGQGRKAHELMLDTAFAKDLMQTDVVTIGPDAPIAEAARLMTERKIGCLPVVDASGLVGIVTDSDFLGLLVS